MVAALLNILGIHEGVIVEEYMFSDGDVKEEWICQSLRETGDPERYFNRVDLEMVRRNISGNYYGLSL